MAIVQDVRARFQAEIKGARKAFQDLRQEAKKLAPDVQKSTDKAGDAYDDLLKTTERLKESIEESGDTSGVYDKLQDALADVQKEMKETGEASAESMERLQREVRETGDYLDAFGQGAAENFDDLEQAVKDAEKVLSKLGDGGHLKDLGKEADKVTDKVDAIGDTDGLEKLKNDTEDAEEALGGLSSDQGVLGGAIKKLGAFALAGGAVAGVGASIWGVVKSGDSLQGTMNRLQGATGASADEMVEMKDTLRDIYAAGYGESFDDIADSMTNVRQVTELSGDALRQMTEDALLLRDVFGYEVQESTRAANVLMRQFGIDGREAMALIAEGTQQGLNYADDLLDTINEYSVYYEAAGFSAQEMFGMFKNAQETGAFNLDYAADAFKEFGIIMTEDSDRAKEALDSIGLSGSELRTQFSKGGEDARKAFQTIADKLAEVDDPLLQNIAGVELFGTKFEDLGAAAVVEMAKTNDAIKGSADTLDEIEGINFNTAGQAIQGVGRILVADLLLPLQDRLMPAINEGVKRFRDFIKGARDLFGSLAEGDASGILERLGLSADQFKPVLTFIATLQENLSRTGETVLPILKRIGGAILDTLVDIWPTVRSAIGAVAGFIGGIVSKIADYWEENGQQISEAVTNAFNVIKSIVSFVMPFILGIIKTVWGNITGVINGAINVIMGLVDVFTGIFTGDFGKVWEGLKRIVSGAVEFIWNYIQLLFFGRILKGVGGFAKEIGRGIKSLWTGVVALFRGGVASAWQAVRSGWSTIWTATRNAFTNVWTFIRDTWNSIRSITSGVITAVRNVITKGWNLIRTGTTKAFSAIWNAIRSAFQAAHDFLIKTVIAIRFAIANAWNVIRTVTTTVFRTIWNTIRTIFTSVLNFITSTATRIWRGLERIWNFILNTTRTVFRAVWDAIRGAFNSIRNGVRDSVNSVWTRIRDAWNRIKDTTVSAFRTVYNTIRDRFADIVNRAKELPGKIGDGIGAMASKVTAGVTKVINTLARTLGKGVNGVIGGINWVLDKIGVDFRINEWDVPQYAKGTDGHPGGLAIVGDGKGDNRGRELVRTPDGELYLSPAQDTLVNLPKGSTVVSAKNTRRLLDGVPHYANGIGETLTHLWSGAKKGAEAVVGKVLDVFSYIKNPGKLLDLALGALGFSRPAGGNFIGEMARGAWDLVKGGAVDYVKKMLTDFGGGSGQGFGGAFRRSSRYGYRNHPITGGRKMHYGDDWAAPTGTPIPAQAAGVVTFSGYHPIRGNYVRIRSGNYERIYQHNSRNAVYGGQTVRQGQIIGYVGSTGSSTGPHLHYEVLRGGSHINPDGHADGGIVTSKTLSWLAEGGWAESVISHDPAKRTSQRAIWEETGRELGFMDGEGGAEAVELLRRIADATERGQDLSVIMDDRIVGRILAPIISEYQKRNEARSKRFSAQGRA